MKFINYVIAFILIIIDVCKFCVNIIRVNGNTKIYKILIILPISFSLVFASIFKINFSIPIFLVSSFVLLVVFSFIYTSILNFLQTSLNYNILNVIKFTWVSSTRKHKLCFYVATFCVIVLYLILYLGGVSDLLASLVLASLSITGFYFWFIVSLHGGLTNE